MSSDSFGYVAQLPDGVREVFQALCEEVQWINEMWRLYLDLFEKQVDIDTLNATAPQAFQLIEENLRHSITMAVCRLNDPPVTVKKGVRLENISLAALVEKVGSDPGLSTLLDRYRSVCQRLEVHRNKQVGHNDLNTRLNPKDHSLPGIGRVDIELVLKSAAMILNAVGERAAGCTHMFMARAIQGGAELVRCLEVARRHRDEVFD